MTKVISFQIPKSKREFVRYQEDRGRHFYDKLHQHPQLQLTVILEGKGQFLSGDYVGRFQAGDVFFLGENAPHVFRSDLEYFGGEEGFKSAGNTIFFDFDALGKALGELEELQTLRRFKNFSGLCFQVFGDSKNSILELFKAFSKSSKLIQFQLAIQLLSILEESGQDLVSLNRPLVLRGLSERDGKRMDQVIQFLLENRFRQIKLDEVAAEAHLSKEAFCRFFKLRTRTTFTRYVLQLRINEAQKLLKETDLGISEIAYTVGFENLSYFNRAFKGIVGNSPRAFRK
ncbi:MAG: AraC family transcriptional regulator [Algoriphagus sp.]|uniref:AraC family transcriptional regulator n=1 Tax=Algoriphagus sp. TaxID=1872435 RepID=UPI00271D3E0A|nr:AraC family transcriptional regulator [Algoriphagus sp.]MDO8965574.1 AraC family transcriptional regulator [Algoriphagus sp.]MDP2039873.1 AraC family transcriptional regulator [Algoriphagus sp.]MDP3201614.1 AraC family transcriptional regulator [Algoriphagus sp.]MDP3473931.1 AraC family transcriptional regulator [Algoriphagus sp.]